MVQRLDPLDLGDDASSPSGLLEQAPGLAHVVGVADEGNGDIVHAHLCSEADIRAVFVGQCGRGQAAALPVDALEVGEHAADHDRGMHTGAVDPVDLEGDLTVVEEQDVTARQVLVQAFIGDTDAFFRALLLAERRIEEK